MLIKRTPQPQPEGHALIWLSHNVYAIIDAKDYEKISRYRWRLKRYGNCFYAVRRIHIEGKTYEVKMHRVIAKTPKGYDCHHRNKNTLDNRSANLQNLLPVDHARLHACDLSFEGI